MLSIIVAFDNNQLIGNGNKLPWHYPEDLKYFKNVTSGHPVVMGSNTFYSIFNYLGKPLPNRKNIVISSKTKIHDDVEVYNSIDSFLNNYKDEEVFVIGGKTIYEQLLPHTDKMYITHINKEFEGNVYFPNIVWSEWRKIKEENKGDLSFCVYEREY